MLDGSIFEVSMDGFSLSVKNVSSDFNNLVFKNESDNTKLNKIIKKIKE